jgi:hypothetical protein
MVTATVSHEEAAVCALLFQQLLRIHTRDVRMEPPVHETQYTCINTHLPVNLSRIWVGICEVDTTSPFGHAAFKRVHTKYKIPSVVIILQR